MKTSVITSNRIIFWFCCNKCHKMTIQWWNRQTELEQRLVYICVSSPFPLITLFNHLGTEGTNTTCLSVPLPPLHVAPFMFNMRQVWTTGDHIYADTAPHHHRRWLFPFCWDRTLHGFDSGFRLYFQWAHMAVVVTWTSCLRVQRSQRLLNLI